MKRKKPHEEEKSIEEDVRAYIICKEVSQLKTRGDSKVNDILIKIYGTYEITYHEQVALGNVGEVGQKVVHRLHGKANHELEQGISERASHLHDQQPHE